MKNIVVRSISGFLYVALIVCALLSGPDWFMWLGVVFCVLAMYEYQSLIFAKDAKWRFVPAIIRIVDVVAAVILCIATFRPDEFLFSAVFILLIYVIIRILLALYDKTTDAFASVGKSLLSVIYIGLPMSVALLMERMSEERCLVLIMFVMIWLNDTGAYCVGRKYGMCSLCERLSPNKTYEGFVGGLFFCVIFGLFWSLFDVARPVGAAVELFDIGQWLTFSVIVSVFAAFGDLFESLMKRSVGVKDSGKLIPGHGGILDRIDSLLLVAPAVFIYALYVGFIRF